MIPCLTLSERNRLDDLERTIKRGQKTFVEVGLALAEIKAAKLYRADFKTFENYCRVKWGWSRPYAYQLIDAAKIVKAPEMSAMADKITTERQARELAKVDPEQRAEVFELASAKAEAEDRPMTARDIAAVLEPEPEEKPRVVAGPMPEPGQPGGLISPPVMPPEHSPEDDWSEAVRNLVWWWGKAKKWEKEEFCEAAKLVREPEDPKPAKNGSYKNWAAFRVVCEVIRKRIDTLENLRPDRPSICSAEILLRKLKLRLDKLITTLHNNF